MPHYARIVFFFVLPALALLWLSGRSGWRPYRIGARVLIGVFLLGLVLVTWVGTVCEGNFLYGFHSCGLLPDRPARDLSTVGFLCLAGAVSGFAILTLVLAGRWVLMQRKRP